MKDFLLLSTRVQILTKVVLVLTSPKFGLKWFPPHERQKTPYDRWTDTGTDRVLDEYISKVFSRVHRTVSRIKNRSAIR